MAGGRLVSLKETKNMEMRCVNCGRRKTLQPMSNGNHFCSHCSAVMDFRDDGDIGYGPPDRRINRHERKQKKGGYAAVDPPTKEEANRRIKALQDREAEAKKRNRVMVASACRQEIEWLIEIRTRL